MTEKTLDELLSEVSELKEQIEDLKYNQQTLFGWIALLSRSDIDVLLHSMAADAKTDQEDRTAIRDRLFENYEIAKEHEGRWGFENE